MLEAATQGAGARAEEERAKAEARVADLAKKRRVVREALAISSVTIQSH